MNPKVDDFLRRTEKWQKEFKALRAIVLDCGLTEELKWGVPCYTFQKHNVVLMHGFNDYCALLFTKGALINDPVGILVQQTKNVQSARQLRFTSKSQIASMETAIKALIFEAVEVEKAGLKVRLKKTSEFDMPEEFRRKLTKSRALKTAFEALTPGRQRAYLLYFASAKQSATREARVDKYVQHILDGKGLNDE